MCVFVLWGGGEGGQPSEAEGSCSNTHVYSQHMLCLSTPCMGCGGVLPARRRQRSLYWSLPATWRQVGAVLATCVSGGKAYIQAAVLLDCQFAECAPSHAPHSPITSHLAPDPPAPRVSYTTQVLASKGQHAAALEHMFATQATSLGGTTPTQALRGLGDEAAGPLVNVMGSAHGQAWQVRQVQRGELQQWTEVRALVLLHFSSTSPFVELHRILLPHVSCVLLQHTPKLSLHEEAHSGGPPLMHPPAQSLLPLLKPPPLPPPPPLPLLFPHLWCLSWRAASLGLCARRRHRPWPRCAGPQSGSRWSGRCSPGCGAQPPSPRSRPCPLVCTRPCYGAPAVAMVVASLLCFSSSAEPAPVRLYSSSHACGATAAPLP